jgi:hypothetical protein
LVQDPLKRLLSSKPATAARYAFNLGKAQPRRALFFTKQHQQHQQQQGGEVLLLKPYLQGS